MVNRELAKSYMVRAKIRLKILEEFLKVEDYADFYSEFEKLVRNAKWLRSQRELSFYGDMDFIPEKSYTRDDALRAIKTANKLYEIAKEFIKEEF